MKVNLITLGCPKNVVDSEYLKGGLKIRGVQFVDNSQEAETVIVNTCGFIESAKEESIDTILQAVELKKEGTCQQVFVTGCLAERYGSELREEIPDVDGFYGNRNLEKIVSGLALQMRLKYKILGEAEKQLSRELLTPKHFAYMKISEGCEHPCTFCAIPAIRGRFKSKPIPQLVNEAQQLVTKGVKELILVAQDSTQYGLDLNDTKQLPQLLRELCRVDGIEWIRLMYAYPYNVTDELIEVLGSEQKIVKYLDMPIQHVSDNMLKRMARRVNRDFTEKLIQKLHQNIPQLVMRTSFIVGFPGESDADFHELYDFVCDGLVERLGVFTYSQEETTSASSFPDQVTEEVKRDRYDLLTEAHRQVAANWNAELVGQKTRILIDEYDPTQQSWKGRTQWDCPEIDHTVLVQGDSEKLAVGEFAEVQIIDSNDFDLIGTLNSKNKNKQTSAAAKQKLRIISE